MQKVTRTNSPKRVYTQNEKDQLAMSLSSLFGARLVSQTEFEKLNIRNQKLLSKTKDIDKLRYQLISKQCELQAFVKYHKKWKPTTREFTNRTQKLKDEAILIDTKILSDKVASNLTEAYKCYINGLNMAAYIMILRTIEFLISEEYKKANKPSKFVPASKMLNWAKAVNIIGGADYIQAKAFIEARNQSVHEIYIPTEKQIMSAFETVVIISKKISEKPTSKK